MDPEEFASHTFIVKIWLEERQEESGRTLWRGHITHVPSGERRYLQDLHTVTAFIQPYLAQMGVKFGWWARWRNWFGSRG